MNTSFNLAYDAAKQSLVLAQKQVRAAIQAQIITLQLELSSMDDTFIPLEKPSVQPQYKGTFNHTDRVYEPENIGEAFIAACPDDKGELTLNELVKAVQNLPAVNGYTHYSYTRQTIIASLYQYFGGNHSDDNFILMRRRTSSKWKKFVYYKYPRH